MSPATPTPPRHAKPRPRQNGAKNPSFSPLFLSCPIFPDKIHVVYHASTMRTVSYRFSSGHAVSRSIEISLAVRMCPQSAAPALRDRPLPPSQHAADSFVTRA